MEIQKALVVDDSRVAHMKLSKLLRERNIDVHWSGSGEDAVSYLKENTADIVFMDVMMPGMDGFETTSAINADTDIKARPPVVMCSSAATDEDRETAKKVGASGFLPKPYTPEELDQVLEILSKRMEEADAISNTEVAVLFEPVPAAPPPAPEPAVAFVTPDVAAAAATAAASHAGMSPIELARIARDAAQEAVKVALDAMRRDLIRESAEEAKEQVHDAVVESSRNAVRHALGQAVEPLTKAVRKNLDQQLGPMIDEAIQKAGQQVDINRIVASIQPALLAQAQKAAETAAHRAAEAAAEKVALPIAQAVVQNALANYKPPGGDLSLVGVILGGLGLVAGIVAIALNFIG